MNPAHTRTIPKSTWTTVRSDYLTRAGESPRNFGRIHFSHPSTHNRTANTALTDQNISSAYPPASSGTEISPVGSFEYGRRITTGSDADVSITAPYSGAGKLPTANNALSESLMIRSKDNSTVTLSGPL